ncbi:hypothetical protein RclHR1_04140006 [Rhizophagus clarus]|uniref:Protein kinase domain-containing protein n=1 Tax=Rhizophagus clarus TaxID=94130 RepID=A0A2Z6RH66_9GLOM|nr:hypothetical protein RclHR1_04140006 [Rhizophagus clarus]
MRVISLHLFGNILLSDDWTYISDFGLSGPSDGQESDSDPYGVLSYADPEVLKGKPYTLSSDIYSFGVIMAELSSGNPPFHYRKNDPMLSKAIYNGIRPEFGKETPEIYRKLACRCMDTNSEYRPTASELYKEINF